MMSDLTEKQEAFAVAFVETGNAAEAYRRAYDVELSARDEWIYVEAMQLRDHPKISPRIKELQEKAKIAGQFTVMQAADEYEKAREVAEGEKNAAGMVSAITGKVKLFGLDKPKRVEVSGADGGPIKTEETGSGADKLAAFLNGIAERSGEAG